MHNDTTILVENISKKYSRNLKSSFRYGATDVVREIFGRDSHLNLRQNEFWALRDINFELKRGEAIGLIGENGCGKTTLLKILSGLIKPTLGQVRIRGRVAPLIALGAGFNPVLTGRENIFINLSILGLSASAIKDKFDDIVNFAEMWDALDAPLRTYSSGMAARLGFACAIHTDPDVLLVDEVLAVGDARFRVKCYRRLAELRERGTSLILVSHSANAVLSICDASIYLKRGQLRFAGNSPEAFQVYQEDQAALDKIDQPGISQRRHASTTGYEIAKVYFQGMNGEITDTIHSGKAATMAICFAGKERINDISINVHVRESGMDNSDVLIINSRRDGYRFDHLGGETTIHLNLPTCNFKAGKYVTKLTLAAGEYNRVLDLLETFYFKVAPDPSIGSSRFYQTRSWKHSSGPNEHQPPLQKGHD